MLLVSEVQGALLHEVDGQHGTTQDGSMEFEAVTFWERPNRNHVRVRRADLDAFAA
jgi:hypothetical protein